MDKKSAYYWFTILAISFVAFQIVQEIREDYAGENLAVNTFLVWHLIFFRLFDCHRYL
ncbi:MAG: hypothetical protein RLZZ417_2915 [Bacteroidota bacterium]